MNRKALNRDFRRLKRTAFRRLTRSEKRAAREHLEGMERGQSTDREAARLLDLPVEQVRWLFVRYSRERRQKRGAAKLLRGLLRSLLENFFDLLEVILTIIGSQ